MSTPKLIEMLQRHANLIAESATALTWVAHHDLNGAADWERRAIEMLHEIDAALIELLAHVPAITNAPPKPPPDAASGPRDAST